MSWLTAIGAIATALGPLLAGLLGMLDRQRSYSQGAAVGALQATVSAAPVLAKIATAEAEAPGDQAAVVAELQRGGF